MGSAGRGLSFDRRGGSWQSVLGVGIVNKGRSAVANKKLGVKRECPNCSVKFYDLNKVPAVCPKCEHSFEAAKAAKPKKERAELPKETQKEPVVVPTEAVSLESAVTFEEADAEQATASSARIAGLDEEEESDEDDNFVGASDGDDSDALLATDDEDDEDVSAMIDADITVDE